MKRFLLFTIAVMLLSACDNKFEVVGRPMQNVSNLPTLTAEFAENATRTYVEDNTCLRWHEGDLISAFVGNDCNSKYAFQGKTGDNSGKFEPVSGDNPDVECTLDRVYALYPYDEDAEISSDGVIRCSLPAVQEYAENSFGKGANTMIAVTKSSDDTFLAFKNVCGYLKIKLYGDATVKSIELRGNDGEKITGAATVAATYGGAPIVIMGDAATDSITLDCGEGVELSADAKNPTEFWFVVPPTEFSKGVTIIATDTDGITFEKSTSNAVAITRNEIQPMAAFETVFEEVCPNNEIWYTSSDAKIVKPYSDIHNNYADALTTFGANIVSNTYKDGKGVIIFDGDVSAIGDCAFFDCTNLTSVTMPDSVTTIGEWAFYYCTSLKSVTIPRSVTAIGKNTFYHCTDLTSVTILDGVTLIGDCAFDTCYNLTNITIPNSVISIGEFAFRNCFSLASVVLGNSVTTIGRWAFTNCCDLTSVTIPDSVTSIGEASFSGCETLKEFKGKFAADGGRCLIVDGVLNSFAIGCGATEYAIPNSVTKIGENAFYWCNSFTRVIIPDSVITIGEGAFGCCYSLMSIMIPDSVTTIGPGAFSECTSFTSFTIPDSVITIGDGAFFNCYGLTSVTIGDSVTTIGRGAFRWCFSLKRIMIPDSVTTIGDIAFYDCESLTSVTIGNSVTTIGSDAFRGCSNLTNVTLGNSVTTIGDWAFEDCYSLTSITIPDSVTTIGNYAFEDCYSLTSVTIGDGVTTIREYAFHNCSSLTHLTLGSSLTAIGEYAFYPHDNLTLYSKATTPPTLGKRAFDYDIDIIYVPQGCRSAYNKNSDWREYITYTNIVEYDFAE